MPVVTVARWVSAIGCAGVMLVGFQLGRTQEQGGRPDSTGQRRPVAADDLRESLPPSAPKPAAELRLAGGFEATIYADDALVHNAYCMTLDADDRVVVSAPGYVRVLVDENGDGVADKAITFADGPRTGAQGLAFDGTDLLAVGDAGLLRYSDANGDLQADGPPRVLLGLKAGGEHHAHAIRRGPDGWWYLICGNETGVTASTITSHQSPVTQPVAGMLLRFRFDTTSGDVRDLSVIADGMRNAYDFDFTAAGDAVTYDSDDEREVSLPWYRPTRIFRLTPGSHAGWMSRSWKRPDAFPEMPEVLARLGRGSPTGVAVCRHPGFPPAFQNSVFVCDWTFGRVVAVSLDGEEHAGEPIDIVRAAGTAGFAPTDLVFDSRGTLYVSAGGRGTTGTIYRIRPVAESTANLPNEATPLRAALPEDQAVVADINRLAEDIAVRSPLARRKALERLAEIAGELPEAQDDTSVILARLATSLSDADANVRKAAMHVVRRLQTPLQDELKRQLSGTAQQVRFHLGRLRRNDRLDIAALNVAVTAIEADGLPSDVQYDAVRLAQLSLGDVGPDPRTPDSFSGYAARAEIDWSSPELDELRQRLVNRFPSPNQAVDEEFVRLIAMLQPRDGRVVTKILTRITAGSHPTDDLHHLFALARIPAVRTAEQTASTASALLAIDEKLAERGLPLDNNWGERLGDLSYALCGIDPALVDVLLSSPALGRPGHVALLKRFSAKDRARAVEAFLRTADANADYAWTPEAVALIGESPDSVVRDRLRQLLELPAVRADAVAALSRQPAERDRTIYFDGINDTSIDVVENCVTALESLAPPTGPQELAPLILALERLDRDAREYAVRSRIARLLQQGTGELFGFELGKKGDGPQREAVGRWRDYLRSIAPELVPVSGGDWDAVRVQLAAANRLDGDPQRGKSLFDAKACGRCHDGGAVGPDLAGVKGRFSREDLFRAIADPDHDVSERYRGTLIQTRQGKIVTGLVVYESVDGVTLKDGQATWRVESSDIEFRKPLDTSLMPRGLLKDATPQDLADLAAYLATR